MMNFIFARELLSAFGLGQKKIHSILSREGELDTKLEDLLCEEETISECKAQNQKLLDFLCSKDNLTKLVHYATRVPQDPTNKEAAYKFPFVATDILISGSRIAEALIAEMESPKQENGHAETDEVEPESKAIQRVLQKVNEQEKEKHEGQESEKQMLVEDLNEEIDLEQEEEMEANLKAIEEGMDKGKNKKASRNSFNSKQEQQTSQEGQQNADVNDEDDEVNVDEDEVDDNDANKQKFRIQISQLSHNQKKKFLKEPNECQENYDYTHLDELFGLLDEPTDQIMPISCGYFNKIVQSLLNKMKMRLLKYLLFERKGEVFNKLMNHLEHHSLAQLMIELLQAKVISTTHGRDRFTSELFDDATAADDNSADEHVSDIEKIMHEVLVRKRHEIITILIERLSSKNRDFELCLNAHMILLELVENDSSFAKLAEPTIMMQLIHAACDTRNPNQAYAINVLMTVIKEFPDQENNLDKQLIMDFQQTIIKNFFDLTYTCLLMLRQSDHFLGLTTPAPENQTGLQIKRLGLKRMRALELIKQQLQSISKYVDINQYISTVLRRQLITTMLDTIEQFEFSSIASQQAIQVLDFLKTTFDDEDLEILKRFTSEKLTQHSHLAFPETGRLTTAANLAAIIKMALVLKKITLEGGLLEKSDSTDEENQKRLQKHVNDSDWTQFCSGTLTEFETKWTKRLEDYGSGGDVQVQEEQFKFRLSKANRKENESNRYKQDSEDSEQQIGDMLKNGSFKQRLIIQRNKKAPSQDPPKEEPKNSEEDTTFYNNQYWKTPDLYNLDDLLAEL